MNLFDAAVLVTALLAVVMGFNAGLLRSLATILAYAIAAPAALAVTPLLNTVFADRFEPTPANLALLFVGVFLGFGLLFGMVARRAVGGVAGTHVMFADRLLGALLGLVRIGPLAVLMVMIFAAIIPPGREPAWLLESKSRPYFAAAGESGLRSLPPELSNYIERLKRQHGL